MVRAIFISGRALLTSRIRTNHSKDKKTFARTVASRLREWNAPQGSGRRQKHVTHESTLNVTASM